MPDSKMIVYVNLMQLVGAHFLETTARGRPAFVLDIERSRTRLRRDPKGKRDPELWLAIEAVESKNMPAEHTHFVTEPLTKDELKQGLRSKPIGRARLYPNLSTNPTTTKP